jgi:signal transduction histidine kinase
VGMTRIREFGHLLNIIVHIVTKTVRISHAAVYLYDEKSEQFLMEAGRNIPRGQTTALSDGLGLMIWLREHRQPLVYEEIQRRAQEENSSLYKEMADQMRQVNAAVVVPSVLEDKVLGFLVLGEKRSKHLYTESDLEVFTVLASQAALAIENARFILEAKFIQEQIAHTEKMATIGTMADGLSHQLNNRFHALSLITEDTIDTLKNTDISGCAVDIQDVFNQMGYALSRIRNNVTQGSEIVEGILKYTRKGGQAKEALSLERIINGTLDMLRYKVKLPEIDIILEIPHDLPHIMGNLVQLQEVFFNLMDNAYDSMMERKAALQEPGYRGRITLTTEVLKNGRLRIVIGDNGMGVKKEDYKKIFTPFFTTKVSSKVNLQKGTGLGLYVIRRIIVDMQEGDVNFESEYRRGTRFIIDLQVAK